MNDIAIRILLLADTHLGFDLPSCPRVERRRRGHDFLANYERALRPARNGQVDLVVHGGDLFHRRRVAPVVVELALAPLAEIAGAGVPVLIVPGNHEGARIPLHLAAATPNLHIFHKPETIVLTINSVRVGLSGFPFARHVRDRFGRLLDECGYAYAEADCRLLCLHQSIEGATVGVQNYVFRDGAEIVAGREIPAAFDAVLAGHIHRSQHLTKDLTGRPLPAPVIYPGSIERTSFAERNEEKQYALISLTRQAGESRFRVSLKFVTLPARPMVVLPLDSANLDARGLHARLREEIDALDPDSVVQVRLSGPLTDELAAAANAAVLRSLAPPTMNISLAGGRQVATAAVWHPARAAPSAPKKQL